MDTALKQRLLGAAVLVALAVLFLPMLVKGPAPDSGVSDVPLTMPNAPEDEMETRELPLVVPGEVPKGGAVGLDATPVDKPGTDTAKAPEPAGEAGIADDPAAPAASGDASPAEAALPAAVAGGDYAVHFGAYASAKGAETVAALAKAAQLPAYTEQTTVGGKPAWRVRIGPYATRAEAESVRLKALEVRSDVPVRVVTLDAESTPTSAVAADAPAQPVAPKPAPAPVEPAKPAPTKPEPLKTAAAKPVESKPAEAKLTETKPVPKPEPKPAAKPESKPAVAKPAPAKPVAAPKVGFAVQLGAFSDGAEATAMRDRLRAAGFAAFTESVSTDKGKLTRVRVGPAADRAAADELKTQVKAKTGLDGIVRPHP